MPAECSPFLFVSRFGRQGRRAPNVSSGTDSLIWNAVDVWALYTSYINLTKSCHIGTSSSVKSFEDHWCLFRERRKETNFAGCMNLYNGLVTRAVSTKYVSCISTWGFLWRQTIYVAGSNGQLPISPSTQLRSDSVHTKIFKNSIPLTIRVGRLWTDHSSGNHMGLVSRMSISRKPSKFSTSHMALYFEV